MRDGDDAQQEPEWKMRGRKVYKRLFGWWERGVPPTWLVIVGCLVVQVGVVIISVHILALIFKAPLLQLGFGLYPVVVKEFAAKEKANPVIFSFYRSANNNCRLWCR